MTSGERGSIPGSGAAVQPRTTDGHLLLSHTTTALMFGRRSYEVFAPVWRDSEDHAAYKDLPKYVVSTTLTDAALFDGWGPTTILRTSDDVASVKQSDGGAIVITAAQRSPAASPTPI